MENGYLKKQFELIHTVSANEKGKLAEQIITIILKPLKENKKIELAEENDIKKQISSLATVLVKDNENAILAKLLRKQIHDIAKRVICQNVKAYDENLEIALIEGLYSGTTDYANASSKALLNIDSPWYGLIIQKSDENSFRNLSNSSLDNLRIEFQTKYTWWSDLRKDLLYPNYESLPIDLKWRTAALLSLSPDATALVCPKLDNLHKVEPEGFQTAIDIIEAKLKNLNYKGKFSKQLLKWFYGFLIICFNACQDEKLLKKAENYLFKEKDQDWVRIHFNLAPVKVRSKFINRTIKKHDSDMFERLLTALSLLEDKQPELYKDLEPDIVKWLSCKNEQARVRVASMIISHPETREDASIILEKILLESSVEELKSQALKAFATRPLNQIGPKLVNIPAVIISNYTEKLLSLHRKDLLEKDILSWLDTLMDQPSSDLSTFLNLLDKLNNENLLPLIISNRFASDLLDRVNNISNEGERLWFSQLLEYDWLSQALLRVVPQSDFNDIPSWWKRQLLWSWLSRDEESIFVKLKGIDKKQIFGTEDTAKLLAELWSEGLKTVEEELIEKHLPNEFRNNVFKYGFSLLKEFQNKCRHLNTEKHNRLPVWLEDFGNIVLPKLYRIKDDLGGNKGILDRINDIIISIEDTVSTSEPINSEVTEKLPEVVLSWLKPKISVLQLNWTYKTNFPIENTWIEQKDFSDHMLKQLGDLLGEVGRRATQPGLSSIEIQNLLWNWLRLCWNVLKEQDVACLVWEKARSPLRRANDAFLDLCWSAASGQLTSNERLLHLFELQKSKFGSASGGLNWSLDQIISEITDNWLLFDEIKSLDNKFHILIIKRLGLLLRDAKIKYNSNKKELAEIAFEGRTVIAEQISKQLALLEAALTPIFNVRLTLQEEGLLPVIEGLGMILSIEESENIPHHLIGTEQVESKFKVIRSLGIRTVDSQTPIELPVFEIIKGR